MRQAGLFELSDQLKRLSDCGDPFETIGRVVDFEVFRSALEKALAYGDSARGGRPPYDPVAMLKVLILAAQHSPAIRPQPEIRRRGVDAEVEPQRARLTSLMVLFCC